MFAPTYLTPTFFPGTYWPPGAVVDAITPPSAESTTPFSGLHTIATCEKFQALGMNSSDLVRSLRDVYMGTPSSRVGGEDLVVLRAFDKVIRTTMYPRVLAVDEGYYLVSDRVTPAVDTGNYRIPKQAHDGQVARVEYDGMELANGTGAFEFRGDSVKIDNATGTVVMHYYVHPPRLAPSTKARMIESIDYETGEVLLESGVTEWTGEMCFNIQSGSRTHDMCSWDIVGTITGNSVIFQSADLKGTSEYRKGALPGDYVTETGYSYFPMLPPSLHDVLVSGAAAEFAKRLADSDWKVWRAEFNNELAEGLRNIDRRSDGITKVVNRNSTIRMRRRRRFR